SARRPPAAPAAAMAAPGQLAPRSASRSTPGPDERREPARGGGRPGTAGSPAPPPAQRPAPLGVPPAGRGRPPRLRHRGQAPAIPPGRTPVGSVPLGPLHAGSRSTRSPPDRLLGRGLASGRPRLAAV